MELKTWKKQKASERYGRKGETEMNRRRIFALLCACSLAAGVNGMTAFAAEPEAEEKEVSTAEAQVSRIVSFTDCTGMHVTYDANASRQYSYEVENGVLTDVKVKKADADGSIVPETHIFEGTVELQQPETGEKYTSVAADLFGGNPHITYVKLPAGVTTISAESFRGCTALKSVYLPSTVKTIEKNAFRGCTSMTQIALPKSVTTIGDSAFAGDTKLRMVYFRGEDSGELIAIAENAFPGADEAVELVIVAEKGSGAEAYAEENGLSFEESEPEE